MGKLLPIPKEHHHSKKKKKIKQKQGRKDKTDKDRL